MLPKVLLNVGLIATMLGGALLIWAEFARKRAAGWGARPAAPMTRLGWSGASVLFLGVALTFVGWSMD